MKKLLIDNNPKNRRSKSKMRNLSKIVGFKWSIEKNQNIVLR